MPFSSRIDCIMSTHREHRYDGNIEKCFHRGSGFTEEALKLSADVKEVPLVFELQANSELSATKTHLQQLT